MYTHCNEAGVVASRCHRRPLYKKQHPQNRKYITYCYAARGGPSYGHKLVKFGSAVFELWERTFRKQTDTQTHKQTYS